MAGYIFSLNNLDSLKLYTSHGVYATILSAPRGYWQTHHEGTIADYSTMQPGDNIYFFIERKIYGIGRLFTVASDCKYFNFPGAGQPIAVDYHIVKDKLLWDEGSWSGDQRCICLFEPDPYFFHLGIDMDDVLASNPSAFKMLRAFWKLSFIKFDDEENQAFRNIILKRNQSTLTNPQGNNGVFPYDPVHSQVFDKVRADDYSLDSGVAYALSSCARGDYLNHEMALEAGILHQLFIRDRETLSIFGEWDYLSHQVITSPFKPIDYMDKMDLFGYSYIPDFRPTKSGFLVGEVKKGNAIPEDIDQLLKYVDWVKNEYSYGDYSMINAFLVAYDFSQEVVNHKQHVGNRKYTVGVRPAQSLEWNNLKLVKYAYDQNTNKITFHLVD